MGYKYKYEDLDCHYCVKKRKSGCKFTLCPYIMENLKDLNKDIPYKNEPGLCLMEDLNIPAT